MGWSLKDMGDQSGKVAVVTGANSGIGFETAKGLMLKGAHVVLACRNQAKGEAALQTIRDAQLAGTAELMALDLSDLASVKAFAEGLSAKHDRLDLLINNAGVMIPPLSKTTDGFELQFGTNHLGHFALTGHLIGLINKTSGARVVTVSSIAHKFGHIDFDNLDASKGYKRWRFYGQSKLANLLFTRELAKRLASAGADTVVAAAHPGWTATNLQRSSRLTRMMNPIFAMKPLGGALPTLYAATAGDVAPGDYFGPRGLGEMRGAPKRAKIAKRATDDDVAGRLWAVSEQLTGVSFLAA